MNNIFLPSRNPASKLIALFAIIASPLIVADQAKAQIVTNASDNAGNYSGGWTNGANGGTGFGAWTINSFSSSNAFGGAFIGNPTNAGIATNPTFGSQAFGLYANPAGTGAFVNADRTFPALQVGQTFSFQWAINWDSEGGNKGFDVYSSGTQVLNVNQGSFPGDIFFTVGSNSINTSNFITFGNGPMTWSFTRTSVTNLTVTSTGRDGSNNIVFTTNIPITGAPNSFRWYAAGMGPSDNRQPYFNNLQVAGPAPTTITNQVTFSVNMSYQASQGLLPSNSTVQVRGDFNNWNGNDLTNQGNNIFSGTFNVTGNEGGSVNYKFWNSFLTNTPNQGYEDGSNRALALGTNNSATNLPTVFFSNLAGQRFVTFSVNMAIQQGKGAFNPLVNTNVQVRGDFNGWAGNQLTNQGGSVYSGSFLLSSSATNSNLGYKFYYASGANDVWEGGGNRSFDLVFNSDGSNAPALSLGTNFFSDELFYTTPTSLLGFATTQGAPSTNQSFTLVGLGLSNNISVTAPTDFELSADGGANYSGILSLVPSNGAYSNSVLARIAAGAAQGSISNNIQLASPGSASASVLVTGNVTAGQTFSNWAQGAPLNAANLLLYSIGGATSPTATNGIASTTTVTSSNLSITAIVRTNDPNLAVVGQALVDLAIGPWSTNGVTMSPSPDTNGVPSGSQRQIWSTDRGVTGKKFLRLQSTLTNN